jgi:C1A family cysteine protease
MAPRRRPNPFGTHRDIADHRDRRHFYTPPDHLLNRLPAREDLRPAFGGLPVFNQGTLNSCSANAIAAALWYVERQDDRRNGDHPSRLFIYYNERARDGRTICRNVPVSLRDGYRAVVKLGACSERLWPYEVGRYWRQPLPACYKAARAHRVIEYQRVKRDLVFLRACLAEQRPFAMGITVYQSYRGARRGGHVPMPKPDERVYGGHAVLCVGYDDADRQFIFRNSRGPRWGDRGYGYLPYEFVMNTGYAWDFWSVRALS